jgi:two-component system sensor histidine kinase CpxA
MRSLYVRVLLASLLTVVLSLAAFIGVTRGVFGRAIGGLFRGTYSVQADQAARAFETGGADGVRTFLADLDRAFTAEHHLVDAQGRDLTGGADRSAMLAALRAQKDRPAMVEDKIVYGRQSKDGRYFLLVVADPPFSMWSFAPFYLVTLATVLFISWLVAVGIASPLRTLASAADRFGRGDLSARVTYRGKSEIGTVASSFNEMADRIQTLMTAERRLLQDISHELRSPLARLNFAAELARTAPDRQIAMDRIQRDIDRLSMLVGELLEITRAEGDPAARRMQAVDINKLVADIVEACQLDATSRGCTIDVEGSSSHTIEGDPELLRRAIENVLRNAVAHAPHQSAVTLSLVEDENGVTIAVRDRGPGVPEDLLTSIFAPFYRVDASRELQTGGIGLGLSITSRAIQLHHGSVRAENAHPGLRVLLTLPTA